MEGQSQSQNQKCSLGGSVATINIYLVCLLENVNDVGLEISIMHPSFPEFPCVSIVLPVMVPVAAAVGPKAEDIHLQSVRERAQNHKAQVREVVLDPD